MNDRLSATVRLGFCCLMLSIMFVLPACEGDTGPAGLPGTPGGTFASAACIDCHHLNSTAITPSGQFFADGLAGNDKAISAGTATTLTPNLSRLPAGETAASYLWTQVGGLATATSSTVVSSLSVTVLSQPTGSYGYKQALVNAVPQAGVISSSTGTIRDATLIVPLTNDAIELATGAQFQLTVFTASGKSYFDLVTVFDKNAQTYVAGVAAVNTGLQTVPIKVPVLMKATTAGTYDWTVSGPTTTVNDGTLQIANFTPVTAGTYSVTVNGVTFPVYAGTWRGEIIGTDSQNNPTPDTVCTSCHNNTIATDNFTPWRETGHAHIFSKNLNSGGHYGPACFQCHTVGFNTNPLAVNNGFDDQPNYTAFINDSSFFSASSDATRYQRMWSSPTYSALAKETNVQCENCHGPQVGTGALGFVASHSTTTNPSIGSARTSMASDVCGFCHGEPLRHSRFQQWQQSGHGQFDLAIEEAVSLNTETVSVLSTGCSACHSAQGFLVYLAQLQSGIPLRTIPTLTISPNTVQPVTCAVCHDPHAEGASSGVPNTATVRVTDNTPKLPGGFIATGVGRGAICIVCHNSRNGGSGNNSYLHQDGDPKFGVLTSYAGPHESCQGDVLMGKNAYFVGNGDMRSPHSLIVDTCANCHMEKTPPPPLLSYNLSGTNHTFQASTNICVTCHGLNQGIAAMLQTSVTTELTLLQEAISNVIITRSTGTNPVVAVTSLGGRGLVFVTRADGSSTDPTGSGEPLGAIPGLTLADLGVQQFDILAKSLWNYYLIKQDVSLGIHNPDFTFLVLGETRVQVETIKEP